MRLAYVWAFSVVVSLIIGGWSFSTIGSELYPIEKESSSGIGDEEPTVGVQRTVLIEQFTGWNCSSCNNCNNAIRTALENYDYSQVAPVFNHVWWPNGLEDPFFLHNPVDIMPRVNYYSISAVPSSCIDGVEVTASGDPAYFEGQIDERLAIPASISIDTIGNIDPVGLNGTITAHIEAVEPIVANDLVVQFALWEDNVNSWERYGIKDFSGEIIFYWGMWDMIPDAYGSEISLVNPGDHVDLVQNFTIEPEWNISELGITIWVQSNSTKFVEQAHVELFDGPTTYDIDLTGAAPDTWQFISFPIDSNGEVETLFNDSIWGDGGTQWDFIQWYDPLDPTDHWKTYSTYMPPGLNDVPNPNNTMGFWVHITNNVGDQVFTVGTGQLTLGTLVNLYSGWNLVGYPSTTSRRADLTLPPSVTMISVFDEGQPYNIRDITALDTVWLEEGKGYWVYTPVDDTWTVDP